MPDSKERACLTKRILITRAKHQSAALVQALTDIGAEAVLLPCIQIQPVALTADLCTQMRNNWQYDWIFFTSANGAVYFRQQVDRLQISIPPSVQYAAIGNKTSEMAELEGFAVDFVAQPGDAGSFVQQFCAANLKANHILHPTGRLANQNLETSLASKGLKATRVDVYDTVPIVTAGKIRQILKMPLHGLTFFSPSAVRAFFQNCPVENLDFICQLPIVAIGNHTATALGAFSAKNIFVPDRPTLGGVVEKIKQILEARRSYCG